MNVRLKRVYEAKADDDGVRILVERLWPRGLSKAAAGVDRWAKEVSPSPELRAWYGHEPEKWGEFQRRYRAELDANPDAVEALHKLIEGATATFVYAAKDETRNSATLLKAYLDERRRKSVTKRGSKSAPRRSAGKTSPSRG